VTLPTVATNVFNVYIGTSVEPDEPRPIGLRLLPAARRSGDAACSVLTSSSPALARRNTPAAPATGVFVYPTIFIGNHSYGQVCWKSGIQLPTGADKSDPLNQTRVRLVEGVLWVNLLNPGFPGSNRVLVCIRPRLQCWNRSLKGNNEWQVLSTCESGVPIATHQDGAKEAQWLS